jgi:hypothetical protein
MCLCHPRNTGEIMMPSANARHGAPEHPRHHDRNVIHRLRRPRLVQAGRKSAAPTGNLHDAGCCRYGPCRLTMPPGLEPTPGRIDANSARDEAAHPRLGQDTSWCGTSGSAGEHRAPREERGSLPCARISAVSPLRPEAAPRMSLPPGDPLGGAHEPAVAP